jgi:hypothetical protein
VSSPVTVQLVSAADEGMERQLGVSMEKIHPHRVVPGLEARATKHVRINPRGKPVA